MRLLQSQRNEVFGAVREASVDPNEFEWTSAAMDSTRHQWMDVLKHTQSGGYFQFRHVTNAKLNRFMPGKDVTVSSNNPGTWDLQMGYVRQWLAYLKRELNAPDLWEEAGKERELVEAASEEGGTNEPFTEDERKQVVQQLGELRAFLVTAYELNPGQQHVLESRISYLEEAASRQGRIDWANNLIGVLLGLGLTAVLPPEAVREGLRIAWRMLGHLLGQELPELPPA